MLTSTNTTAAHIYTTARKLNMRGRMCDSNLEQVLMALMQRYNRHVPQLNRITSHLSSQGLMRGLELENDHLALRSFGHPSFGIKALENIFLPLGYERRDEYQFEEKKLRAHWYSPPSGTTYPRIFISELLIEKLSSQSQDIIRGYLDEPPLHRPPASDESDGCDYNNASHSDSFVDTATNYLLRLPWRVPSHADYQSLQSESEYASWVLCHGHVMNHFTIAVHELADPVNTVAGFNDWLEREMQMPLNAAGGKCKVSDDGALIQSSTMAEPMMYTFEGGAVHTIPGSFVEFAQRLILPQHAVAAAELAAAGKAVPAAYRREGFEVANADKIFESTFS